MCPPRSSRLAVALPSLPVPFSEHTSHHSGLESPPLLTLRPRLEAPLSLTWRSPRLLRRRLRCSETPASSARQVSERPWRAGSHSPRPGPPPGRPALFPLRNSRGRDADEWGHAGLRPRRRVDTPAPLRSGSWNTWVEGGGTGWIAHLHPAGVGGWLGVRRREGREWKKLAQLGSWRDRAEWKRSYKWEPLGTR